MITTKTGLEKWRRCAERLELRHPYPGNAASSETVPTLQPKQRVNTTCSQSVQLQVCHPSGPGYPGTVSCANLLLSPSLQMKPRRSWHHTWTCKRVIYLHQEEWSSLLASQVEAALAHASKHLFPNVRTLINILYVLLHLFIRMFKQYTEAGE